MWRVRASSSSTEPPTGRANGSRRWRPTSLVPKRLALLKEALPAASRIAVLWQPGAFGERTMRDMTKETEVAGRALGVQLQFVEARDPDALDRAFSAMGRERADAFIVLPSAMLYNERRRTVALAARSRLPAMYQSRQYVELGGLMAYGASITEGYRRAATYVDRILKGAKPGDLPVEQPTKFELLINLKTARTLGLTIPPSLLQQADRVIE
jgi:putative ABC transport system substrate-binding protein